jgi:hypothetical protein
MRGPAGKKVEILWRRYEAFGGWLGHLSNFRPGALGDSRDEAGRPWFLFLWMGWLGVVAVAGALIAANLGTTHPYTFSGRVFGLVISLSAVLAVLGMGLGARAGYVPYVPDSEAPSTSASAGNAHRRFDAVPVRVTGVVDAHSGSKYWGRKQRYRERPGTLGPYRGGVLRISVGAIRILPDAPWAREHLSQQFSGYALLELGTISAVTRGTAYLATKTKPAIRLRWIHGPVILTFADVATRDEVFGQLLALRLVLLP